MKSLVMAKFLWRSKPLVLWRVVRTLNELYRAAFVSTASSEGVFDLLRDGPRTTRALHDAMRLEGCEPELEAWLDLGVSLGELARTARGYHLRGVLSRQLSAPENDTLLAFFQVRVLVFFEHILRTPALLKANRRFLPNLDQGELFARSSRMAEAVLVDLVDRIVPKQGAPRMLEVGCGSGIYIQRACRRNLDLQVVGLELTDKIADYARDNMRAWGLDDRVAIESKDIRTHDAAPVFDIVSLYNLIYYFPLGERVALLRHLGRCLRPEGRLVLVTLTRSSDPSSCTMHLWSSMTQGSGPLPLPQDLLRQLTEAGFGTVQSEELIPGFWAFTASEPSAPQPTPHADHPGQGS